MANKISLENFFGINIQEEPDKTWKLLGVDDDVIGFEKTDIEDATSGLFKSGIVRIDTSELDIVYHFAISPLDYDDLVKIVWQITKEFGGRKKYTFEACKTEFSIYIDGEQEPMIFFFEDYLIAILYDRSSFSRQIIVKRSVTEEEIIEILIRCGIKRPDDDEDLDDDEVTDESYDNNIEDQIASSTINALEYNYIDYEGKKNHKVIKNGNFFSSIVGYQYKENIEELLQRLSEDDLPIFHLQKEPDNEFDKHAIAVYYLGEVIGYIPKRDIPVVELCLNEDGEYYAELDHVDGKIISIEINASFQNLDSIPKQEDKPYTYMAQCIEVLEDGTKAYAYKYISREEFMDALSYV